MVIVIKIQEKLKKATQKSCLIYEVSVELFS